MALEQIVKATVAVSAAGIIAVLGMELMMTDRLAFATLWALARRKRALALCLAFCALGLGLSAPVHAQTIIPIDAPAAGTGSGQGTVPGDISPDGTIGGYYADGNNVAHGFLRGPGGQFTTIDAPGAGTVSSSGCLSGATCQGTYAESLNAAGAIAGFYIDGNDVGHSFLLSKDGTLTPFDAPGAGSTAGMFQGTYAYNINPEGAIAGGYTDGNNVYHGFLRAPDGTITPFDAPGAGTGASQGTFTAAAIAINLEGAITGGYFDSSNAFHAYVRAPDGIITTYDVKGAGTGAFQGTNSSGINDLGTIMGNYIDASGVNHGYVRDPSGGITTFNVKDAGTGSGQGTVPEGNNDLGLITGNYIDASGVNHGFLRSPFGAITTFDVPGAGAGSGQGTIPFALNLFGAITGYDIDGSGVFHGFLYNP